MSDPASCVRAYGLAEPAIASTNTGSGLCVAIVDSGINFDHPHLGMPSRGVGVEWNGAALEVRHGSHRDVYGHGTCCAALTHVLAPDAELVAVRVTGDRPTTDVDRLARGIAVALEEGASIIAVPMGTITDARASLDATVAAALHSGAVVVAASPGHTVLPAFCPGAIGVEHLDGVDVALFRGRVVAEGRARPAPGFLRNFWGPSLATARTAAALARLAESTGARGEDLVRGFKKALIVL